MCGDTCRHGRGPDVSDWRAFYVALAVLSSVFGFMVGAILGAYLIGAC